MAKYDTWLTEDSLKLLESWARNGLTDAQISHNMGIGIRTLYEWKVKFPQFAQALKKGKEIVDIEVENALFKKAIGYEFEETITVLRKTKRGEEVLEQKKIKKHSPPDTTAAIFWLKNRNPEAWRDKQEVENINKNIEVTIGDWDEDEN